jgi:DNA-binding NtrC family response regulator
MGSRRLEPAPRRPTDPPGPKAVLLVGNDGDWPPELKASLHGCGYTADNVAELSLVPSSLADGEIRALLVCARPLVASELLVLRRVREASPGTAIVVVTRTPTHPDLKRAFESGATTFLSWPASPDALRQAIESGEAPGAPWNRSASTRRPGA